MCAGPRIPPESAGQWTGTGAESPLRLVRTVVAQQ